jgi:hypothetical protein
MPIALQKRYLRAPDVSANRTRPVGITGQLRNDTFRAGPSGRSTGLSIVMMAWVPSLPNGTKNISGATLEVERPLVVARGCGVGPVDGGGEFAAVPDAKIENTSCRVDAQVFAVKIGLKLGGAER